MNKNDLKAIEQLYTEQQELRYNKDMNGYSATLQKQIDQASDMESMKMASRALIRAFDADEVTVSEFKALNGKLCDRIVDIRANTNS
jgi:hypothetical protein